MKYLVVENRKNETISCCLKSAESIGVKILVLDSVDGGERFDDFCRGYIHMSSNSADFEKICFRRYFVINEYLRLNEDVKDFFLLDSDVLLFPKFIEYSKELSTLGRFSGSYVCGQSEHYSRISPHASYWLRSELFDFIDFLMKMYRDNEVLSQVRSVYSKVVQAGKLGGVSDMTAIYLWQKNLDRGFTSSSEVRGGVCLDHNISVRDNFFVSEYKGIGGAKYLGFDIHHNPYAYTVSGEKVYFGLIHFQGRAKVFMKNVVAGQFLRFKIGISLLGFVKQIRRYIRF